MVKTLATVIAMLLASNASGFTFLFINKNKHLDSSVIFYAGISQLAPDGRSFNDAFEDAALDWQSQTRVSVGAVIVNKDVASIDHAALGSCPFSA